MSDRDMKEYIYNFVNDLENKLCDGCLDCLWDTLTEVNNVINTIEYSDESIKRGKLNFGDKIVAYEIIYKDVNKNDDNRH